jgi:hypothetical protein
MKSSRGCTPKGDFNSYWGLPATAQGRTHLRVSVEHVGAAKRAEDGTVDLDKGDLVDRFEW